MSKNLREQFTTFLSGYDEEEKNATWKSQSRRFRDFWNDRIMAAGPGELDDVEIDEIVKILDRHGKGNTATSEAIARVMIPQGAWRRMFNEIKAKKSLREALDRFFQESDSKKRAVAIDNLYAINKDRRNSLTGQSGNAVNAMLAAYDPFSNLSAVSLNHRKRIIEYFGFEDGPDFVTDTIGKKIVVSNAAILEGFRKSGITNNARTVSAFLYAGGIKELWTTEQEENEGPSTDSKAPAAEAGSETGDPALFYMESQLEDFLIENWDKTELGKRFDLIEEDGDLKSQQYRTGIGVIDILVQDKETKQLVVIELKKNQTSDDTVGQFARYMGWLQEHKTNGKPTKGIIIAARYDERLHYALKMLKDVEVYLYRVDFRLAEYSRPS